MGRAALIVILGMMGVYGLLQVSLSDRSNSSTDNAVDHYSKQYARNIAHSEINRLSEYLCKNPTYRSSTNIINNVLDGYTATTVKDTTIGGEARIAINCLASYSGENITVKTILKLPEPGGVPPFINDYAVASGSDFTMTNGTIDNSDPTKNGNIHTNANFKQNNGNIYGFVNHVGTYSAKTVAPPDNPYGLPEHQVVSPITIPPWSLADFAGRITDTYTSNLSINGAFPLGTLSNPKVINVKGNLTLGSSTNMTGYGIFLVEGDVSGSGGASITAMDPNKINVGIYNTGKMSFSNGDYANMLLYSNTEIKISNGRITGGAVSTGKFTMSDGAIHYKASSSVLVPTDWKTGDGSGRVKAVAVYE
jgi:hypothetical protein